MAKIFKKKFSETTNVYDAAIERYNTLYDRFDKVVVSFSGGKDSTVCLNLALQVAKERNRLPLEVIFFDEEAIHPETIEYVERVAQRPEIDLKWLCLEVKHRNACSRSEPYWICWDRTKKDKWVRPLPPRAITEWDNAGVRVNGKLVRQSFVPGITVPIFVGMMYSLEPENVAVVRGIRSQESMRRFYTVASREVDNWYNGPISIYWSKTYKDWRTSSGGKNGNTYMASPIYDWTSIDVWTAPKLFGWDYNRAYDVMAMAGLHPDDQRVCPPYGEEPLGGLYMYALCWPHLWHKMIARVHGAATAGRYARTELYGYGGIGKELAPGQTWRQKTFEYLDYYPPKVRAVIARNIQGILAVHKEKTNRPIPDDTPDLYTGLSWRFLAMLANRGDLKGRRQREIYDEAVHERRRLGIAMEDVLDTEGGTRY